jgi:hypothetical protein
MTFEPFFRLIGFPFDPPVSCGQQEFVIMIFKERIDHILTDSKEFGKLIP